MRLNRIDALRFGHLQDACAQDLGEGLTVILGPNESGKSTLATLVRHVLYGFPDRRSKDRLYTPVAGDRHGRLVFHDGQGEWAIDRVEGRKGGSVTVKTLRGEERPRLLEELTAHVLEPTFRIVFGFGLDELASIEDSSNDDVIGRLYAAGAGLPVSPVDVRRALDQEAAALYAASASKPLVNTLAREIRETQKVIRELESQASDYAADQARASELREALAFARKNRDDLDVRMRFLAREVGRLDSVTKEVDALAAQRLAEVERREQLERRLADFGDVEREETLVQALPALDALLEDASAFRQRLTTVRGLEEAERADRSRAESEFVGLTDDIDTSIEAGVAVERWRDRLAKLELAVELALATRDQKNTAAETARDPLQAPAAAPSRRSIVPPSVAVLVALLGLASGGLGLVFDETVATITGGVLVVLGLVLFLLRTGTSLDPAAGQNRATEEWHRRDLEARDASADAKRLEADLATARAEWKAWLGEHHLDAEGTDPSAVLQLLERARGRERVLADARLHRLEADRERAQAVQWAARLVAAASPFIKTSSDIELEDVMVLVERARAEARGIRDSAAERKELMSSMKDLDERLAAIGTQENAACTSMEAISSALKVEGGPGALPELEARLETMTEEHKAAVQAHEATAQELHELKGRLDEAGRDERMATERLRLESLREQLRSSSERFLVLGCASRLLGRAQERYERDRQPEVVQTAGRIFGDMTDGRYTAVRVPLGSGNIEVIDERGTSWTTDKMSRGTAEQLYLALRIGLIEQLGQQGEGLPVLMDDILVNFDAARRTGAARAIGELASHRQVIVFTCHTQTADVLKAAIPGTVLLELDRCTL